MSKVEDLSRSITVLDQARTVLVVVEMSQNSWLMAGMLPGVQRHPLKKLDPDPNALLGLITRWRSEAEAAGMPIDRVALAFEAGRDGFWLARWLQTRGIDAHVIHSTSVAVNREHRRAKTDRLDTAMLMRVFLGWLRGERGHCRMVAIPSLAEEDAKRPSRERENLVSEKTRIVNRMKGALARLGIRGFKPELRRAPKKLPDLRTPEGQPLPPNMLEEMRREMARLAVVRDQYSATIWERRRIAAPELLPKIGVLPQLICSRRNDLRSCDEEGKHGDTSGIGDGDQWTLRFKRSSREGEDVGRVRGSHGLSSQACDATFAWRLRACKGWAPARAAGLR